MKDSPESGVQAGVERQSPREEVEMTAETAGVVKNPTEWAALARETAREVVKPERRLQRRRTFEEVRARKAEAAEAAEDFPAQTAERVAAERDSQ